MGDRTGAADTRTAVCKFCGILMLASQMVRLEGDGYIYACTGCAVGEIRHRHSPRSNPRAAPF
jgi:hypothetical protein